MRCCVSHWRRATPTPFVAAARTSLSFQDALVAVNDGLEAAMKLFNPISTNWWH